MAIDNGVVLRNGSVILSASEASPAAIDFNGQDLVPLTYQVDIPSVTGTTPTLDVVIEGSNTSSTTGFQTVAVFPQINAPDQYMLEAICKYRWRRAKCTLGGTTPNFGNAVISASPAGRYDKK